MGQLENRKEDVIGGQLTQQGLGKAPDGINNVGYVGREQKADTFCSVIEGKWQKKSADVNILSGRK